jgi:hypothetical protein
MNRTCTGFEFKHLQVNNSSQLNQGTDHLISQKDYLSVSQIGLKDISIGAKEVLIKSVAQAIPTYVRGVFKLPATMCDDLTCMICIFGGVKMVRSERYAG